MMDMRRENVLRMENNPELTIGDVTTVNLTILSGGKQDNVVPPYMDVTFDVRLAIDVDHKAFEDQVGIDRFKNNTHSNLFLML